MKSKKKKILAAILCMVMVLTNNFSILAEETENFNTSPIVENTPDTESIPETPKAEEIPDTEPTPETPKAEEIPDTEPIPETPKTEEIPDTEPTPETPKTEEIPDTEPIPETPKTEQVFSEEVELVKEFKDTEGNIIQKITAKLPKGAFEAETSQITMEVSNVNSDIQRDLEGMMTEKLPEGNILGDFMLYKIEFKVNGEVKDALEPIVITFEKSDLEITDTKKANVFYLEPKDLEQGREKDELIEITQRNEMLEYLQSSGQSTEKIEDYELSSIEIKDENRTGKIVLEGKKSTVYGCYVEKEAEQKEEEIAMAPLSRPMMSFNSIRTLTSDEFLEGRLGNEANAWQIVKEKYNTQPQLTEDGLLRIQKNVIPTDVENEFYIYVNMEPVLSWEEIFLQSTIWLCNNNNIGNLSGITEGITASEMQKLTGGHVSQLVDEKIPLDSTLTTQPNKEEKITEIQLMKAGKVVATIPVNMHYGLSQQSSDSFTIIYSAPNSDGFVKLSNISRSGTVLTIPEEAWGQIIGGDETGDFKLLYGRVEPTTVTDPMGDYIEYLGEVKTNNGTATFNNNTLTWKDFTELDRSGDSSDFELVEGNYYRKYAYQLSYKIRLKVEKEGFNSCAEYLNGTSTPKEFSYPTNGTTTVNYRTTKDSIERGPANFKIPEVRGLLYNVEFQKVDKDTKEGLAGATFRLTGAYAGKNYDLSEVSAADGYVKFRNLPWGTYSLEETQAPEGYNKTYSGENVILCYTHNKELLEQDHNQPHKADHINDIKNMLYSKKGEWKIENEAVVKKVFWNILKVSASDNNLTLEGATFTLSRDGLSVYSGESDGNGVVYWKNTLTNEPLNSSQDIEEGIYTLSEIKAPTGYTPSDEIWTVEITAKGAKPIIRDQDGKDITDKVLKQPDEGNESYVMTIENEAIYALPSTGSHGTFVYMIGGTLLLMAATLLIYKMKRGEVLKS